MQDRCVKTYAPAAMAGEMRGSATGGALDANRCDGPNCILTSASDFDGTSRQRRLLLNLRNGKPERLS